MHQTLRYILTKAADLGAMSRVVRRMFGNQPSVFRDMREMSGDMDPMLGNMAGLSDNNSMLSGDLSAMSCDLSVMPCDIGAMSDHFAGLSLVSMLKSLNPLLLLRDLAAKLWHALSEWYWRRMGFPDPVRRKIFMETDFDDLFTVVYVNVERSEFSLYNDRFMRTGAPVHFLLDFLVVEKAVRRRTKFLLAVVLVLARKALGLMVQKRFWTLPWQFALPVGSGRSPLSPRPPPFAAC